MRIADAKALGNKGKRDYLLQESNQLVAIYVTTVRTLQDGLRQ